MDTQKQTEVKTIPIAPAQLWVGSHAQLIKNTYIFLQTLFCKKNACGSCIICIQISQQQHHASIWIYPEKQYTRDDLEIIFKRISFSLQPDEQVFFILQKADFLTTACANSLLKSLEEPPPGYHFLLLAQRTETILPTIRSRCLMRTLQSNTAIEQHQELFHCFTNNTLLNAYDFLKLLDQSKMSSRESIELFDALLEYWSTKYADAIVGENIAVAKRARDVINNLQSMAKIFPMPGSSKLFWKNLYLKYTA